MAVERQRVGESYSGKTTKWGIIYCPKAGITNKRKRWEKIQKVLDARGVSYDFVQSETAESVERLMKMMINNGYKTIIIVGGDSALNDAVNCLMMEEGSQGEYLSGCDPQWCHE